MTTPESSPPSSRIIFDAQGRATRNGGLLITVQDQINSEDADPTNSAILLSYLGHDDMQEVPSAAQNTDASQDVLSFSSRTYTPTLATPEILFIITLFFSVLQLVTNVAVCYLMYTIHDRIGRYRTSRPIIARYFFLSINIVPILVTFTTTVVHKLMQYLDLRIVL